MFTLGVYDFNTGTYLRGIMDLVPDHGSNMNYHNKVKLIFWFSSACKSYTLYYSLLSVQ